MKQSHSSQNISCQEIGSLNIFLEAIICPQWEYRYFSYQRNWSETEECCEMRNGEGDQMLIIFFEDGSCCINSFAHASKMNGWKNIRTKNERIFNLKN